jgi:hypothetical protein
VTTDEPPGRQYSEDGRHWWDGSKWQPVWGTALSNPPAPSPESTAAPPRMSTAGQSRRIQGWLLLALVAGAAVLVGLVGGSTAGRATVRPHGPSAVPGFTAGFPTASQRYLQGVTVAAISRRWQANSFTCGPATWYKPQSGEAKHMLQCDAPGGLDFDVYVQVNYDDEGHVSGVQAYCRLGPGKPYCKSMFVDFGNEVFRSQPSLQKQAADWCRQNVDSDSSTVIGGVRLVTSLQPASISAVAAG